jgi:hypothetical protein
MEAKYLKLTFILLTITIFVVFSNCRDSDSITKPSKYENYMPLGIGNMWKFNATFVQTDIARSNHKFIEIWKVIETNTINDTIKTVLLKTELIYTSDPNLYSVEDTLTININKGIISFVEKTNPNFLSSNISFLLKHFLNRQDHKLCIYQPHSKDGLYHYKWEDSQVDYTFFLSYTLEHGVGFNKIDFRHYYNFGSVISMELFDYQIN